MAIWSRGRSDLKGLVHHSDRGVQYLAIRYTERLADAGAARSVGSRGDSYDNALAESVIGLYKTEVIRKHVSKSWDRDSTKGTKNSPKRARSSTPQAEPRTGVWSLSGAAEPVGCAL